MDKEAYETVEDNSSRMVQSLTNNASSNFQVPEGCADTSECLEQSYNLSRVSGWPFHSCSCSVNARTLYFQGSMIPGGYVRHRNRWSSTIMASEIPLQQPFGCWADLIPVRMLLLGSWRKTNSCVPSF